MSKGRNKERDFLAWDALFARNEILERENADANDRIHCLLDELDAAQARILELENSR